MRRRIGTRDAAGEPVRPFLAGYPGIACLVDARGRVVEVSRGWRRTALAADPADPTAGVGSRYATAAVAAWGPIAADTEASLAGVDAVRSGAAAYHAADYLRRSAAGDRWFGLHAVAFPVDGGSGALVVHVETTTAHRARSLGDVRGAALERLVQHLPVAVIEVDRNGGVILAEGAAIERLGIRAGHVLGASLDEAHSDHREIARAVHTALAGEETAPIIGAAGRILQAWFAPIRDDAGAVTGAVTFALDVTDQAATASERDRLARAVEQATDAIGIADGSGRLTYANAAFERAVGLGREALVGRDVASLAIGRHGRAALAEAVASAGRGSSWSGEIRFGRRDGTSIVVTATIVPIVEEVVVKGLVVVARDVTAQRAEEAERVRESSERAEAAAALARLTPRGSLEETASEICRRIGSLPDLGGAGLFLFDDDGPGITQIAFVLADGSSLAAPGRLRPARCRELRRLAAAGAWVEAWDPDPRDVYSQLAIEGGARALAFAPMVVHGGTVGLLVAHGRCGVTRDRLATRLRTVQEVGAIGGAILGPFVADRRRREDGQRQVRSVVAKGAFHTVYQPIVELEGRRVVGYEALTRFADGVPPDVRFRQANDLGVGLELEAATLERALTSAGSLPANAWLAVNVSPGMVLAGDPLGGILHRWGWQTVLEVTEHVAVDDYSALRSAVERLGPTVRIAVDDAGAGFASFRHILELRPHFVKLDIDLIHGIDHDPARQALVAGMRYFADRTGCGLVAEGVETEAELAAVRSLGIPLAQGYLLGRPTPAMADASTARWAPVVRDDEERPSHPRRQPATTHRSTSE